MRNSERKGLWRTERESALVEQIDAAAVGREHVVRPLAHVVARRRVLPDDVHSAVWRLRAPEADGARAHPHHLTEVAARHVLLAGERVVLNLAVPLVRRLEACTSPESPRLQ